MYACEPIKDLFDLVKFVFKSTLILVYQVWKGKELLLFSLTMK